MPLPDLSRAFSRRPRLSIARRRAFRSIAGGAGGLVLGATPGIRSARGASADNGWFMPDEGEPHRRTWMAFGASAEVWGRRRLAAVRRDLATIAVAIADHEPVTMLVRPAERAIAGELTRNRVELVDCDLDDLWIRDTGPVFVVTEDGQRAGIDFNFNGWGEKQAFDEDAEVAARVCELARVPRQTTDLVLEGGGLEVDGEGTAIITESCVLNDNRNPGVSRAACERELKRLLGLEKIIWLPGIKGRDITDGHTDFYARFAGPGVVVAGYDPDPASFDHQVTKRHLAILEQARDAAGRPLDVVVLEAPSAGRDAFDDEDFAAGYINFYVCNGAVIAPEFGDDRADGRARATLERLYPDRTIVQLNIDAIAAGGGGIHCTTQQEPSV